MNITQFEWVLSKGIDINLMTCLLLIHEGNKLSNCSDIKVKSWMLLLKKHQLLTESEVVTEKGEIYISEYNNLSKNIVADSFNFDVWCEQLHEKLKERLLKLTGKSQKVSKIRQASYSYLCNVKDLTKKLKGFVKVYNVKNYQKIEDGLLNYINKCHKEDSWFPLIEYYIMKDGTSKLATDFDIVIEKEAEAEKPIDTKSLF